MREHEQTPFVIAFGKALFAVPDPCPWCGGVREYHPTSGGSSRLHSDGCAFFAIQHEHDKAVGALSARVAKLEAALRFYADDANYRFQNDAEGSLRSPAVNEDHGAEARAAEEAKP